MPDQRVRFTIDLDPAFQRRLKAAAARRGLTMRTYTLQALEKQLGRDEAVSKGDGRLTQETLERLDLTRQGIMHGRVFTSDSAEIIRRMREERSKDLEERSG